MSQVTIPDLLSDVSRIQKVTLPYVFDTALLADKECHESITESEHTIDDTAAFLKSLAQDLSVTLVNINDMQAAALYLGSDCIARSDSTPVNVIESVFKSLIKKPYISASIIEKPLATPFSWSSIDKELSLEVTHG